MIPVVKRKTIQEDGSMIQPEETLTLRDGRPFTIRSVEPEDAPRMIEYIKPSWGKRRFCCAPRRNLTAQRKKLPVSCPGTGTNPAA